MLLDFKLGEYIRNRKKQSTSFDFKMPDFSMGKREMDFSNVYKPFSQGKESQFKVSDYIKKFSARIKEKLGKVELPSREDQTFSFKRGLVGLGREATDLVDMMTKAPSFAKELLVPTRISPTGEIFDDERLKGVKPTAKDNALATPRVVAEFTNFLGEVIGSFSEKGSAVDKFVQTKPGDFLADLGEKIKDFSQPKNAEQAAAMRMVDVLTILPMGSLKVTKGTAELIARSRVPKEIANFIKKDVPKITDKQAETLSRFFVDIEDPIEVQRSLNKITLAQQEIEKAAQARRLPAKTKGDIPSNVRPDSIAKKMDEEDANIISNYLQNPTLENFQTIEPVLKAMKIDKADDKIVKQFLIEAMDEYGMLGSKADRSTRGTAGKFTGSQSGNDITSSISKAKASGQSFDEWVKGQGEIHRGDTTPIKLSEMDTTKVFNPAEKESLSAFNNTPGLYFTDSVSNAKSYGQNLTSVSISPTAKVINVNDAPKILKRADVEKIIRNNPRIKDWATNWDENFDKAIKNITDSVMAEKDGNEFLKAIWSDGGFSEGDFVNAMKKAGVDGIIVPKEGVNHFVIYNKDVLKTRSQLKAEWDKIRGGEQALNKAIPEMDAETFDISTKKTTQQGIKLTPEIKAKIQGKAPTFKASGEMFGAVAGVEVDEEGNIGFDPTKAAMGFAGLSMGKKAKGSLSKRQSLKSGQLGNTKKNLPNQNISYKDTIPQPPKVHKAFTSEGRVLVDESGNVVYPRDMERAVNPLEKPVMENVTPSKEAVKALEGVSKKHGETEEIIKYLEKKGVSAEDIDKIILENGVRLVDTVKVKRETNGVLSAVITKQDIASLKSKFNQDIKKWIPTKTAMQKVKEAGRTTKLAALEYYELPQVFFQRTGLSEWFYTPIREAERNAQNLKTSIFSRFEEAGLYSKGSWFTPSRFTLSTKDAENVGRYYLGRQGKAVDKSLDVDGLSEQARKFVKIFDEIIEETEPRFYKVAELNGKEPGVVPNYAPLMTGEDFKLAQNGRDIDYIFRKHPAFFSLKKRVEDVPFELYELDYRKVASRWIDQMSNFLHLGEVGPQTKYLANSDEFTEIVGGDISKTANKWLQDTFNPNVPSSAEKLGRFGRKSAAIASLGLNYASVVKQVLTQIPLTIIEKTPPKLSSQFAKHFDIKVSDLPSIRERRGNAAIMDMQEGIQKAFVGPLSGFDKVNAQSSLNALLDKQWSKLADKSKDISPEIQAQVIKLAQDKLDMWYGGMTRSQLPKAFRTEIGKLINMFIHPLTSQLNAFVYAVAKEKGIMKAEKLAEVLAAGIAIAYLEQVITNLSPEWSDKKEMTVDVLSSLAGNIPLVSQIVFAFRSDQPLNPSPAISNAWRFGEQVAKALDDRADALDVGFAFMEMFGLPKQFRKSVDGVSTIMEEGLRDKNDKLLAPVDGVDEKIRAFLRGKYGTIATQDYIRNIGVSSDKRRWFVPEVEFLQNGDYERKAELFKSFDLTTQLKLYAELSEGQQKKLDSELKGKKKKKSSEKPSLDEIFGEKETNNRPSLEEIFR